MTDGIEHVDVLVVGAGISGIGAGRHLKVLTEKSFLIIERESGLGGTWRTHTFPGIRSDSDLYTFGYGWKPWTGKTLATADQILAYLSEAVEEVGLAESIRYGVRLVSADWSSADAVWRVTLEENGAAREMTAGFLWMCQGYYDHETPYRPEFPEEARFSGPILHPQLWPEDQEVVGKRFAVIGSGATAATLVPALAKEAAHVTVVQRSPTFYFPKPMEHELAAMLRPLDLPDEWFHEIMRRRILHDQAEMTRRCKEEPDEVRAELIGAAELMLEGACSVDPHFTPGYRPWRQRLAAIPEGDLYQAIRRGAASMVTGDIARFVENGIEMADGSVVEADVIVSATGLNLQMMGGVPISVDGAAHDFSTSWTHRGMMFTGVPNLAWTFGYIRASWTLRADLVAEFVCRLLGHMDEAGARSATPRLREEDEWMPALPFFDPEDFNPGYITRALPILPRRGDRDPWTFTQDYAEEAEAIPAQSLTDGTIAYA